MFIVLMLLVLNVFMCMQFC